MPIRLAHRITEVTCFSGMVHPKTKMSWELLRRIHYA